MDGPPLSAPVDFINNAVNNVSGTIELRSVFTNDDETLVPGQLVNVTVQLNDIPNALVVPHEAVNVGPDGDFVFVIEDGKADTKPVTVLFDDGKSTAITGGVAPGDKVVTEGQLRLTPGSAVEVEGALERPVKGQGGKGKGGKGKRGAAKEG
jgi:multidrug efflux system membrane fusion protein